MNTSVDDRNCADLIREELDQIDRANAITGRWMMTFAVITLINSVAAAFWLLAKG